MRRRAAPKRAILPDPLFGSEIVSKFINCVMSSGTKSVAERIVYNALESVVEREGGEGGEGSGGKSGTSGGIRSNEAARQAAISAFEKALELVRPTVEVKSRRVGGSTYQIPIEIRPSRQAALAMRWLVEFASKRGEKTMDLRLAGEIYDATHSRGGAVKKREDTHRMAKANQAFAHYRW